MRLAEALKMDTSPIHQNVGRPTIPGEVSEGSIEHKANVYAIEHGPRLVSSGYCFNARDGGSCGLCVGMKVRLG